ncbi:putative phosphate transport system substrate-binding protein [Leptolyngbya sp. NIES-3755]|nr:putative phosphate transport system substrate-binding protein [Leptolyngbya sp. NIES-3755]
MVHKSYSSTVGLALLLTGVTVAEVQLVRAQTAFKLPNSVAEGTNVRIDGSVSMAAINSILEQRFEQQFPKTQVNAASNGVPAGIQAVLSGQADLAAIGRPLNNQEKAQGLQTAQVGRDKIAIVVGANNPFNGSLTIDQFARMFRGEITNWSQVGGPNLPIKFVDRPDSSDTREAFKSYPVFRQAKFTTGANAVKLNEDTTQAVVSNLGNNGISYMTASQAQGLKGAKIVTMHGTQPTNPRYPFSQALYYVYKDANNPAVQAFLGLATTETGQSAIAKSGGVLEPVVAAKPATAKPAAANKPAKPATTAAKDGTPAKQNAAQQPGSGQTVTGANPQGDNPQGGSSQAGGGNPLAFLFPGDNAGGAGAAADTGTGLPNWLWWLLPIGSGAALLWMLAGGRRNRRRAPVTDDRGATGTFNAPGYSDPDNLGGAPYVEGGYDPIQTNGDYSTRVDAPDTNLEWNTEGDRLGNLDLEPNVTGNVDRAHPFGGLGGAALAGGAAAGAAGWALNRDRHSKIVLKSRSSQEVEAFWDIPTEERQAMKQQGGEKLALRLYDVTDIDLSQQPAHSVQQFDCDELTQRQRLPIALPDRDYLAEIGYLTPDNEWLSLARSTHVRVPAASGNSFLGNVAKAGGAAVAGGAVAASGAVDSAKSFLSGDRDTEVEPVTDPATPATEIPSENWFQRITHRVADTTTDVTQSGGAAVTGGAAAAGAGAAAWSFVSGQRNSDTKTPTETPSFTTSPTETTSFTTGETASFTTGETTSFTTGETTQMNPFMTSETVTPSMPTEFGEGRLVLSPRNARWAYATWDLPRSLRSRIDRNAGDNLVLRLYDVTDGGTRLPSRYEQHDIDEMALSCDVPIPLSDRTYIAEVGYVNAENVWTPLARSTPAHIPAN